jgi:hypothetical protein
MMGQRFATDLLEMIVYGDLIVLICFAFFNGNRAERTITEAGAQAITEVIGKQPGLAVDDLNCTFST